MIHSDEEIKLILKGVTLVPGAFLYFLVKRGLEGALYCA